MPGLARPAAPDEQDGKPQILRKTVRLNNDYIRQVIDVYHI
jgi:benzoate/toluate 1,2-dioxygenase beta subunit